MKKKIFSPKLYCEFLRQLRLPGWIFTAVLTIEAIIFTAEGVLNSTYYNEFGEKEISVQSLTFLEFHPFVILGIFVIAPVLMFCALSWVNKRNSSDFYHSLCETRECIFISSFAAAVSWLLISLVGSSVVAVVSHMIFPKYFVINYLSVVTNLFVMISGSVFVMSCIAIAMSLTGTIFNNIIVSCIMLFLPQSILFAIRTAINSNLSIVADRGVFAQSYNIPFAIFEQVLNGNVDSLFDSIPHAVYTLIIAIVYFVVASLLFKIRKSEFAGNSSVGKKMQSICRILVGTTVSLIPAVLIFDGINNYNTLADWDIDVIFSIIVLYIIMIVAVGVYELIATKKFRNLVSAAKSLIPIAVINVALIGAMFGVYYGTLAFTPDTDDIKSVQILQNYNSYGENDYFAAMANKINIDSDEARELVSVALKANVEYERNNNEGSLSLYRDGCEVFTVAIKTFTGTHYREIVFTPEQYEKLMSELEKNKEYQQLYLDLPEAKEANITFWSSFDYGDSSIDELKVYNLIREDVAAMDFAERFNISSTEHNLGYMEITIPVGTKNYSIEMDINDNYEKAYNYLMEIAAKGSADKIDDVADYVGQFSPHKEYTDKAFYVDVCFYNLKNADGSEFTDPVYTTNIDFKKLAEVVRSSKGKIAKAGQPYISVECYVSQIEMTEWGYEEYTDLLNEKIYIPLDSDKLPDFYITSETLDTEQAA